VAEVGCSTCSEIYTSAIRPLIPIGLAISLPKSARNGEFVVKNHSVCAERHQIDVCFGGNLHD
jgi:hypothetical protein